MLELLHHWLVLIIHWIFPLLSGFIKHSYIFRGCKKREITENSLWKGKIPLDACSQYWIISWQENESKEAMYERKL
ncbi:hypothetical protein P8452_17309 [Trifolium repens]|nr:hypothetical protein P8452_17309 [Trifolium repens]